MTQKYMDLSRVEVFGTTDKNPLSYAPGENMNFSIRVDFGGQDASDGFFLNWTRTGDDGITESGKEKVSEQPMQLKTSCDRPGFVRIYAELEDMKGQPLQKLNAKKELEPVCFDGGAAVEPEKLTGTPEPEDFDAFWNGQKAKLSTVPIGFTMDKKSSPGADIEVFAISIDCAGPRPATGYLTMPANARDRSLPVLVRFDGYGMHTGDNFPPEDGPKDLIDFHVNAHGYELGRKAAYYDAFLESIKSNGYRYAFDPEQNKNPETCYFNGMVLRIMRALQFVKQLPQWNGKSLTVHGGSQGGLQASWAAGLDPDVTLAQIYVPWCCDLGGVENFQRVSRLRPLVYMKSLDYYDPINFAKRIKCPVDVFRAGLGDYVCPPSGVAVFYNNLKCPKKITWVQGSTHGKVPSIQEKFLLEE